MYENCAIDCWSSHLAWKLAYALFWHVDEWINDSLHNTYNQSAPLKISIYASQTHPCGFFSSKLIRARNSCARHFKTKTLFVKILSQYTVKLLQSSSFNKPSSPSDNRLYLQENSGANPCVCIFLPCYARPKYPAGHKWFEIAEKANTARRSRSLQGESERLFLAKWTFVPRGERLYFIRIDLHNFPSKYPAPRGKSVYSLPFSFSLSLS